MTCSECRHFIEVAWVGGSSMTRCHDGMGGVLERPEARAFPCVRFEPGASDAVQAGLFEEVE